MNAVTLVVGGVPHHFEVRAGSGQKVTVAQAVGPRVILEELTRVSLEGDRYAELVLDESNLDAAAAWFALASPATGFLPEATAHIEAAIKEAAEREQAIDPSNIVLPGGFYKVTAIH